MNSTHRLNDIAPDLIQAAMGVSPSHRQSIAYSVANWACEQTDVPDLLRERRMDSLLDSGLQATKEDYQILDALVQELDERYFSITDDHDGLDEAGEALRWFSKARAVASLRYAIDSYELANFCESIYEAYAATDNLDELRKIVLSKM